MNASDKFDLPKHENDAQVTPTDTTVHACTFFDSYIQKLNTGEITLRKDQEKNDVLIKNYAGYVDHNIEKTDEFCRLVKHDPREGRGWCRKKVEFNRKEIHKWAQQHQPGVEFCSCNQAKKDEVVQSNPFEDYLSVQELLDIKLPPQKWLVTDMVRERTLNFMGGAPAAFKSFLSLYIAVVAASGGGNLFDKYAIMPMKVLLLDEENRGSALQERIEKLRSAYGLNFGDEIRLKIGINQSIKFDVRQGDDESNIFSTSQMERLRQQLISFQPDLVIIDSLIRFMTGEENSATDVRKVTDALLKLCNQFNCAVIVLHHTKKGRTKRDIVDMRGSGDFVAAADAVFILNKISDTDDVFEMSTGKMRTGHPMGTVRFRVIDVPSPEGLANAGLKIIPENIGVNEKDTMAKAEAALIEWMQSINGREFKTGESERALESVCSRSYALTVLDLLNAKGQVTKLRRGVWQQAKSKV